MDLQHSHDYHVVDDVDMKVVQTMTHPFIYGDFSLYLKSEVYAWGSRMLETNAVLRLCGKQFLGCCQATS